MGENKVYINSDLLLETLILQRLGDVLFYWIIYHPEHLSNHSKFLKNHKPMPWKPSTTILHSVRNYLYRSAPLTFSSKVLSRQQVIVSETKNASLPSSCIRLNKKIWWLLFCNFPFCPFCRFQTIALYMSRKLEGNNSKV